MELDRHRIDEIRRLLLKSFMAEDTTTYSNCVLELERLIGVEHGDRNPKDQSKLRSADDHKRIMMRAHQFRWGDRTLDAELYDDGILTYSISYGSSAV